MSILKHDRNFSLPSAKVNEKELKQHKMGRLYHFTNRVKKDTTASSGGGLLCLSEDSMAAPPRKMRLEPKT